MTNLLILSKFAKEYRDLLQAAEPDLKIFTAAAEAPDCEVVFGEPALIAPQMASLAHPRWVQSTFAGVDPLLQPGMRRDYLLTNMRGVFGDLMVEFVLGYLLLHERHILQHLEAQQKRQWHPVQPGRLRGKTIGLLGVGTIGSELAKAAKFLGMKVRGYTFASENCPEVDAYFHGDSLPAFANGLDYLVNILPGTSQTRHIINAAVLQALPPHALFLNVGRGSAVDEQALIHALQTGAIAGAVLDVFTQEPLPQENPLWGAPNVLLTSHTSAPSFPEPIAEVFLQNYRRYQAGEALLYRVDFEKGY